MSQFQVASNQQKTYGSTAASTESAERMWSTTSCGERRVKRESFSDNIGASYAAARYIYQAVKKGSTKAPSLSKRVTTSLLTRILFWRLYKNDCMGKYTNTKYLPLKI